MSQPKWCESNWRQIVRTVFYFLFSPSNNGQRQVHIRYDCTWATIKCANKHHFRKYFVLHKIFAQSTHSLLVLFLCLVFGNLCFCSLPLILSLSLSLYSRIADAPIPPQCMAKSRVDGIYGCKVNTMGWYYNQNMKRCMFYSEASCKPSLNDFKSREACESMCVPRRGWCNPTSKAEKCSL